MTKRSQITMFAIAAVLIVIIIGLFFHLRTSIAASKLEKVKTDVSLIKYDIDFLKTYFESCLKKVSQNAIWLTGYQGGYINTTNNTVHGDYDEVNFILYNGYQVPYYLEDTSKKYPSLKKIEEKIARYAIVEFKNCIDATILENKGFNMELPSPDFQDVMFDFNVLDVKSNVSINEKDITIQIYYPIKISKKSSRINLDNFFIGIQSSLDNISNYVDPLLNKIIDDHADPSVNNFFCPYKNDLENNIFGGEINIYVYEVNANEYVIRFAEEFKNILQFAVKDVNLISCS